MCIRDSFKCSELELRGARNDHKMCPGDPEGCVLSRFACCVRWRRREVPLPVSYTHLRAHETSAHL
eukprot:5382773-Alexandrium_andersonii.AAC.1